MDDGTIASLARAKVDAVRDSTADRYRLAAEFYRAPHADAERGRYRRAELSFLRWEIERGVLEPPGAQLPGSPWWRAVSDRLLGDKVEADLLTRGGDRSPSSRTVALWVMFIRTPSPAAWYRAHNASIVAGYLKHQVLAAAELSEERFMMNVALLRVVYAHALAAAPRLALGLLAPLGRLLGDPRRGAWRRRRGWRSGSWRRSAGCWAIRAGARSASSWTCATCSPNATRWTTGRSRT